MKNLILIILLISCSALFGNGILIMNAVTGSYLNLNYCNINVKINNQVAITTSSMSFYNQTGVAGLAKFAFPLKDNASATSLRWLINGEWHQAVITQGPQSGIVNPGESINPSIDQHLGKTPVVFSIPQTILADSSVVVELTYVQLLPYANGRVSYSYPSNYDYLYHNPLDSLSMNLQINSSRQITELSFPDLENIFTEINGTTANSNFIFNEFDPNMDIRLTYTLSMENLGIASMSTLRSHNNVPDNLGDGFFLTMAEPEPSGEVIQKYFTFMIDRSNCMSGTKLTQAKNAASYMVNNLNEGDYFNIVDFSTIANAFAANHVPFNEVNRNLALNYINHLEPFGSTNYSGAFDMAIPQFNTADLDAASIIVFLTGSQANTGIIETDLLLEHINNLISETDHNINLFCFGVGTSLNFQLLSAISNDNNGTATIVGLNNLEEILVGFFSNIRNPIVLNPSVEFSGQVEAISQVFPDPLPNLYLGQQMLICGRYNEAQTLQININGTAYGNPITFAFEDTLASEDISDNVFLMKIWAKLKIENLLIDYYLLNHNSPEAIALHDQIVAISTNYGVLCVFTNFSGGDTSVDDATLPPSKKEIQLLGNYPNPFNPNTKIRLAINVTKPLTVQIKIYNLKGQLIKILSRYINNSGTYDFLWNGTDEKGQSIASGIYFYQIQAGGLKINSKMLLLK